MSEQQHPSGQGQWPDFTQQPDLTQRSDQSPYGSQQPHESQQPWSSWDRPTADRTSSERPGSTRTGGRKGLKGTTVALLFVLTAGVGGLSGWAAGSAASSGATAPAATSSASPQPTRTKVVQATGSAPDWSATAKAVSDSVVSITVRTSDGGDEGSGVVLDTKGNIVTNNHVVAAATSGGTITVGINNHTFPATIVGTDPSTDLAVIRLTTPPKDLTPITFADSSKLEVGSPVMAIGNPLGLSGSVTTGIISALNRPVTTVSRQQNFPGVAAQKSSDVVVTSAIQTSAPINPGNSGGALVNADGELIGINSSIASLSQNSEGQSGSIGIGFAIPSDLVRSISDQLISTGKAKHAYLGIRTRDAEATVNGVTTQGAGVAQVTGDGPAGDAGMKVGDVITEMNGVPVTSGQSLVAQVRSAAPGSKATFTVTNGSSTREVTVTLAASK